MYQDNLQIEGLKLQLAQKQAQINHLQTQINSLYNSRSWKFSKPIRVAGRIARKILPQKVKKALKILKNEGVKALLMKIRAKLTTGAMANRVFMPQKVDMKTLKMDLKTAFCVRLPKTDRNINKMKQVIDVCDIVSFDIFDTLLCRITSKPTDAFRIMEHILGIKDFSEMRQKLQFEASVEAERTRKVPHADLDEIYDYIKRNSTVHCDWDKVKEFELETENALLYPNPEIKEVYDYAISHGKRVIAVSDMYIKADFLEKKLKEAGYNDIAKVYVSSECNVAKFRGEMFPYVLKKEKCIPQKFVHIGDNRKDDFELALPCGIKVVHYENPSEKTNNALSDSVHDGIVNLLRKKNSNFWFCLGVDVGGRIYTYLYNWFVEKIESFHATKIYFLSRDGYNLYEVCKQKGMKNIDYMYSSRRALLLAGIESLTEKELSQLPPFTTGQSVSEILDYLGMDFIDLTDLRQAGFSSCDDLILSTNDFEKFRQLYLIKKEKFLELCAQELENAKKYFKKIGLLDSKNTVIFDCGWNGSSQYLLNKVLRKIGFSNNLKFLYAGLFDNEKSRNQLSELSFETCFFGFDHNKRLTSKLQKAIVLFELFFGAPHNSVLRYSDAHVGFELENTEENFDCRKMILEGIKEYVSISVPALSKFCIKESPEEALSPLIRLMQAPTAKEAIIIGDLENVDGFVAKKKEKKYLAKVTMKQIKKQNYRDFYWMEGILKRPDIANNVKRFVSNYFSANNDSSQNSPAEISASNSSYKLWIEKNELDITATTHLEYKPLISIVVPVYNVLSSELVDCIESVINQTYDNWELCMVDDASTWKNVKVVLKNYESTPKVHISYHSVNSHISKTTNDAIALANGEFIAFLDCDDVLAPNAIYEMTKKLNFDRTLDFVYSDEDKLSLDGKTRRNPFFKPDWSPDTFMSLMYTCHFSMYRKKIVDEIGGLRVGVEGAQDYDFTLRFTEKTTKIGHISKILYHWRERPQSIASDPKAKPYALQAIKVLKEDALKRRGLVGEVVYNPEVFQFRVRYSTIGKPLTSIVIPSKDNFDVFERCVSSIRNKTSYDNYEIIVVDNGSSEKNKEFYERAKNKYNFKYIYSPMPFNFSKMCNIGAQESNGHMLVFLNNDTEIIQADWLDILVGHASVPWTGAVGAKLLYPNSTKIQHIGVINLDIGPSHAFIGCDDTIPHYYCINKLEYNFSAVTAACLAIRKERFSFVGGFDEKLPIAYNDVDFCFKLVEKGFFNVVRNDVTIIHYESYSRGSDDVDKQKQLRLENERAYLYNKHPAFLHYDPFYNHNLTQNRVDFELNI